MKHTRGVSSLRRQDLNWQQYGTTVRRVVGGNDWLIGT